MLRQALVVIVHRNAQNLIGLVLTNDVFIQKISDFNRLH